MTANSTPSSEGDSALEPPVAPEPAAFGVLPSESRSSNGWAAAGVGTAYLLFWQAALRIQSGHIAVVWLMTLLSLLLVLSFCVLVARAVRSARAALLNVLAPGILVLPGILTHILLARYPEWSGWPAILPTVGRYEQILAMVTGLRGLLLIWFASGIGVALAGLVREFKLLLPVGVVLAAIDVYVVTYGLVSVAARGTSGVATAAMRALTVALPARNPGTGATPFNLLVGFADFLFIAMFFSCFAKFRIPAKRTFVLLWISLVAYMLVVFYADLDLPALAPIAVVVLGMNIRRFQYDRSEVRALAYAGLIVAFTLAVLLMLSRMLSRVVPESTLFRITLLAAPLV